MLWLKYLLRNAGKSWSLYEVYSFLGDVHFWLNKFPLHFHSNRTEEAVNSGCKKATRLRLSPGVKADQVNHFWLQYWRIWGRLVLLRCQMLQKSISPQWKAFLRRKKTWIWVTIILIYVILLAQWVFLFCDSGNVYSFIFMVRVSTYPRWNQSLYFIASLCFVTYAKYHLERSISKMQTLFLTC